MKFEHTNKKEQREGLIFKKTIYYSKARIIAEPDEMAILSEMANSRDYKLYPIGEAEIIEGKSREWFFYELVGDMKKGGGTFERGIRSSSPEFREYNAGQYRDMALKLKEFTEVRQGALMAAEEDQSEEL